MVVFEVSGYLLIVRDQFHHLGGQVTQIYLLLQRPASVVLYFLKKDLVHGLPEGLGNREGAKRLFPTAEDHAITIDWGHILTMTQILLTADPLVRHCVYLTRQSNYIPKHNEL